MTRDTGVDPQGFHPYPMGEWDIALCVTSGQVFRWRRDGDAWLGVDGPTVMWLRPRADGVDWATFPEPGRLDRIRDLFQLDVRLDDIKRSVAAAGPDLAEDVERFPGLRLLRWHSVEECLLSFLCTVNNNIPRITSLINKLATHYGQPLALGLNALPPAAVLAGADETDLRRLGFGYRSSTLLNAAKALRPPPPSPKGEGRGGGSVESLRALPYADAHTELLKLPGVGRKVADCVCLFGLHKAEAVPIDTHLWQACCDRYFPEWRGKSLTDTRYRQIGDMFRGRFGELAGWAHQYLFYSRIAAKHPPPNPLP